MIHSKIYQTILLLTVVVCFSGIYTWRYVWFLPSFEGHLFLALVSVVMVTFILAPMLLIMWRYEGDGKRKSKVPSWVVRYLSPISFVFIFSYPIYFSIAKTIPACYTKILGTEQSISLVVSKRYTSGKRVKSHWVSFRGYQGPIRVSKLTYNSLIPGKMTEAIALKSNMGYLITEFMLAR